MFFEKFLDGYDNVLMWIAEFTVSTLELIGIGIIIIGAIRALIHVIPHIHKKGVPNIMISLGRSLALALEFKMGAEIVNTVIIRDIRELAVLGIVIALRTILAMLIHWEIRNEQKHEQEIAHPTSEAN